MFRNASLFLFAAAAAAAAVGVAHAEDPSKTAADPNKIVCKRETVTGSLADSKRECHTRAEWQQMAEQNRDQARSQVQSVAAQGGTGH